MTSESTELQQAADWMAQGHTVAMATVIRTWGSAPRSIGSHLVIRADGLFEGSVSGGCVEGAVISEAQAALADGKSRVLSYGVSDAQAWEVGLACGGQIEILVQPNPVPALLAQVIETLARGEACAIVTDMATGLSQRAEISVLASQRSDTQFVQLYQPVLRLAVVGAVHIAQALVPMAQQLGYEVLLIDPRTAFADAARFAGVRISHDWPDEALRDWRITSRTAIVTLTHDPKLDDPALEAALRSNAFYIGALGSQKTHAARMARLQAAGFDAAALARINGPAGLRIGAKTPAEIAVSVLAQMTENLRKVLA
jgi:xanthine dehydrogenase accessory factor